MMNNYFWLLIVFAMSIINLSCTHWIIDMETRIQMENQTDAEISNLSLISKNGQVEVLIPETLKSGERSKVYEKEWIGEFHFVIFSKGSRIDLGFHKLKGNSVFARIEKENGKFTMRF